MGDKKRRKATLSAAANSLLERAFGASVAARRQGGECRLLGYDFALCPTKEHVALTVQTEAGMFGARFPIEIAREIAGRPVRRDLRH